MSDDETFGTRLAGAREAKGLSQPQLAELVLGKGDRFGTISRWENDHAVPDAKALAAIAKALGVSADYLLGVSGGANGTEGDSGDVSAREVFQQLRTIIESTDTPPAYRVLMIDAVGGVLSRATLYRGEVTAGYRAVALQEAERTDRERQHTIRHVEENAHIRALEMRREPELPDMPMESYPDPTREETRKKKGRG